MGIFRLIRAVLNGFVVALACFGGANLLLGLLGGPNRNDLWIRGGGLSGAIVSVAVAGLGLGLALRRPRLARGAALVLALSALLDAVSYQVVLHRGPIAGGAAVSLSLLVAVSLAAWALQARRPVPRTALRGLLAIGAGGFALVLAHLLTFGATDYRRPADAAVVFGAAVYADGSASGSLLDRTHTACALYHEGLVSKLVLSGGRNPAVPISEPECMARLARAAGVPDEALILDETGATSASSLAAVDALAREHRWARVLLVSHDYHLARLHLLARPLAVQVYTVPARETVPWPTKPAFVLREVAAWSWHFLRTASAQ